MFRITLWCLPLRLIEIIKATKTGHDRPRGCRLLALLRDREATPSCPLPGGLCCKSLLSISAGNIDSRSGVNTQQRFKRTDVLIRLFQISISQSPFGDFCNTIEGKAVVSQTLGEVGV